MVTVNEYRGMSVFLYILMRDHLPWGTVNAIMKEHVEPVTDDQARGLSISSPGMYEAAMEMTSRILTQEDSPDAAKS